MRSSVRTTIGMVLVCSACGLVAEQVDVTAASLMADGKTLELVIDACATSAEASTSERSDSVRVSVEARVESGDCGYSVVIELAEPLGDRVVVDEYDDESIPVSR